MAQHPPAMKHNLPTLSILHYVYGALVCLGGFAALLFMGIGTFLSSDLVMEGPGEVPPDWLGSFFKAFGAGLFVVLEVWGILILLSGYWISQRRNRTASIVIAALCLLSFPIGTALGIFTLVVLANEDVRQEYEQGPTLS
jgi:hypothetical protein